jgi:hypothetical protein
MQSLPDLTHEHHARILVHVERLPTLAGMIGRVEPALFSAQLDEEYAFIVGRLVPHMAVIETTLYGDLERLMERRHSMTPMRREHDDLRRLIASLGDLRLRALDGPLADAERITLRRVLYRLYSMLKVHLAEEQLYLGVLDRNLSADEKDALARAIEQACAEPV